MLLGFMWKNIMKWFNFCISFAYRTIGARTVPSGHRQHGRSARECCGQVLDARTAEDHVAERGGQMQGIHQIRLQIL